MKKTAIQFALYLHMHPEKGQEQWYLMRTLPEGVLDLLQAASSKKKRSELAESVVFNEQDMKQAFVSFLLLVLEGHQDSPYRGLAAKEKASLERCKLHKKLLLNIFHPDKMPLSKNPYLFQQIQDSYEQVKIDHSIPLYHSTATEHSSEEIDKLDKQFGGVKVNNAPRPSTAYRRHQQKNHINYVLMCGILGLVLVGVLIVLIVPSNPQSIVRQNSLTSPIQDTEHQNYITLAGNTLTTQSNTKPLGNSYQSDSLRSGSKIQLLINELETALEGDLISELQSRLTSSQSSKQINDLFISADQKKVFLHSFSWKPISSGFYGEGKFLTRFQFIDRGQWVTRTGKFFISLTENKSKLHIKQFHFEDNLH